MSIAKLIVQLEDAVAFAKQIDTKGIVTAARSAYAQVEAGGVDNDLSALQTIAQELVILVPAAAPAVSAIEAIKMLIKVGETLGARPVQFGDPAYALPDRPNNA